MRRYAKTAANPDGVPEDTSRCIASVERFFCRAQCTRRRGHGRGDLFCSQHAGQRADVIVPMDFSEDVRKEAQCPSS